MRDEIHTARHEKSIAIMNLLLKLAKYERDNGNESGAAALERAWHAVNNKEDEKP